MSEAINLVIGEVLPKYSHIKMTLAGTGGNLQVCLARFSDVLKAGGVKKPDRDPIIVDASSSDREHMFQVINETVTITEV